MNKQPGNIISIVGVPMDLGGSRSGSALGPGAIRCAGLIPRLQQLGYSVKDEGDLVTGPLYAAVRQQPGDKLKHLDGIVRVNEALCAKLSGLTEPDSFPLVLGGDHSIAIGTLAGLRQRPGQFGLIWLDAHTDANTAETTPSGNIHGMPLAVALGYGDPRLTGIGGSPYIQPQHTVIIGARSVDPGEREFLTRLGIAVFTVRDIDRLGMDKVMERALAIATNGTDGVHVSFDLDVLDPQDAPGVGTPIPAGLRLRECLLAMEAISASGAAVSAEFVEVNPTLDIRNRTAEAAVDLIGALFGETLI
jgi:arginase